MARQKIYCYVDETGQDTQGAIFIVSVIIVEKQKEEIIKELEKIEKESKKGKVKWRDAKYKYNLNYLTLLFQKNLPLKISYSFYKHTKEYLLATVISISKAIIRFKFFDFKTVVLIDGLSKNKQRFVSSQLHRLKIKTEKVRGIRKEETDALLRLADAIAGFIRKASGGDKKLTKIINKFLNKKIFEV